MTEGTSGREGSHTTSFTWKCPLRTESLLQTSILGRNMTSQSAGHWLDEAVAQGLFHKRLTSSGSFPSTSDRKRPTIVFARAQQMHSNKRILSPNHLLVAFCLATQCWARQPPRGIRKKIKRLFFRVKACTSSRVSRSGSVARRPSMPLATLKVANNGSPFRGFACGVQRLMLRTTYGLLRLRLSCFSHRLKNPATCNSQDLPAIGVSGSTNS